MYMVIIIITICSAIFWIFQLYSLIRTSLVIPRLKNFNYSELEKFPLVSVIITACNEADNIEEAVNSRLQDDYPALEFLLINDRSTDGTSELVDKIAAKDPRVRAIHITELPEGWLGKIHALHRGVQEAAGEWFLFSDADVYVKPGTLKQLIARCEMEKIDHTAILPELFSTNFFVDASVSVLLRILMAVGRGYKFEDEKSNAAGGAGAFNLVKRTAFEKTKGFPWLKLEIIDDLTLGQMLKTSGARISVVSGIGFVGVRWYSSFREMVDGIGRAGVAGIGNFRLFQHFLVGCVGFILDMMPFVALFHLGIPYLPYLGLFILLIAVSAAVIANRLLNLPLLPGILLPIGHTINFFILIHGGIKFFKDKGIYWRGTFYPKKLLIKGRRFKWRY